MVEWEKKMSNGNDKFKEFFETHQVFNSDEFQRHCAVSGYHARNVLSKYTRSRHIRKLRNKLYTVLPEGSNPESFMPSPLLVAAKSSDDSVLSYSSALAYYVNNPSLFYSLYLPPHSLSNSSKLYTPNRRQPQ